MITPPTCPSKLTRTKTVAKNFPQFHDMFMYSRCSFHLKHKGDSLLTSGNKGLNHPAILTAPTYGFHPLRTLRLGRDVQSTATLAFLCAESKTNKKLTNLVGKDRNRFLCFVRQRTFLFWANRESEILLVILMMWNLADRRLNPMNELEID